MVKHVIVAMFKDKDAAVGAATAIKSLATSGTAKFKLKAGVMLRKDDQGNVSPLEAHDRPLHQTKFGATVGALIGLIAGPAGAALGAALGAGVGVIGDAVTWGLSSAFVNSVTSEMGPGTTAIIVEADEGDPGPVNEIVKLGGGRVYREAF